MTARLVPPSAAYRHAYVAALREGFRRGVEPVRSDAQIMEIERDFSAYLRARLDQTGAITMPDGSVVAKVPFSVHWLVDGPTFIGEATIRHELNDWLRLEGGHIGYGIRPSLQGQGFGKLVLALALEECRKLGLARVLVTCLDTNRASARIIEANRGVLEDMIEDPWDEGRGRLRRYWIGLDDGRRADRANALQGPYCR